MDHSDRSDADLMRLAQSGERRAFAVLLHRHGPAVRACVHTDRDPPGATIATFVAAMRALRRQPADDPVRPWLLALAQKRTRRPDSEHAADPPPFDPDELDEIWAELDVRWPRGRASRSMPRWVAWAALLVVLVSLAVVVPYLLLTAGTGNGDDATALEELVARPYDEEIEREPAQELFEPLDEPLEPPTLEPDVPEETAPEPQPTPEETPAPTEPAPDPTPDQTPTQQPPPQEPTPPPAEDPQDTSPDPPAPQPDDPPPATLTPPADPPEEEPDPPDDPEDPEDPEDPGGSGAGLTVSSHDVGSAA